MVLIHRQFGEMTTENVLQPLNCNLRDTNESPPSKRSKRDFAYTLKSETAQRWSLSAGQNELEVLAEMGLGMLDSDDVSECNSEDSCRPSSSRLSFEHNDTNPDLIIPGEYISGEKISDDVKENFHSSSKDPSNELSHSAKTWENFCIYRRSSMVPQDAKDWFKCLSDEIILMVFRWLPKLSLARCALVCKRWHRLTSDETLWTRLDCSLKVLGPGALGHVLSRQTIILKLSQAKIIDPAISPGVKAHTDDFVSKLMYLDLSMATVSANCLATLFKKCKRLRKVSLESCKLDEDVCSQLSRSEHLEVLNLTMVEGLNTQGVSYILRSCQQLKELNVSWTGLSVEILNLLCKSLPKRINRLNLSGCRKTLNNTHIKELAHRCPNLKELDLSDGTGLTNEAVKFLIPLNELNFLALSRCYGIQCNFLKKLSYMSSLQFLDIHGGHIEQSELDDLQKVLGNKVQLNKFMFSSISRPTVGMKRSSIWGLRVRD